MARNSIVVLVVAVLVASMVAPVAAHGWQTEVKQGDFELGVSSTPEEPVAGMNTEFAARIADDTPADSENRLDWGGVTNTTVEVHINGPGDIHDHVKAEIPEDDAHFHFNYIFPEGGTYTITVVAELEGEEYAFEFQRDVMLLPAKATGEEMEQLSSDVETVNQNVESTNQNVQELQEEVETLQDQVDTLQGQIDTLQQQLESDGEAAEQQDSEPINAPGFGVIAALIAALGAAFLVGNRR